MSDVTHILSQINSDDQSAAAQLLPLVYDELRKLAAAKLQQEPSGQTLQATALVHEAYVRLVDVKLAQHWKSRGHFFAAAAEAMRRILVENARRKTALKHGGNFERSEFSDDSVAEASRPHEIIAVHDALDGLAAEDSIAAELVKLHYFSGFSLEEAAELLNLSRATAYRNWTFARAWLRASLQDDSEQQLGKS